MLTARPLVFSLRPPPSFGELALLYNSPRQASVQVARIADARRWWFGTTAR